MQQILIKGFAGMTHMFHCTVQAFEFSNYLTKLNIPNTIYHDWRGWECFNEIYNINHKNFNTQQIPKNSKNLYNIKHIDINNIIIPPNVVLHIDQTNHTIRVTAETFFNYFSLTNKYKNVLREKLHTLNNGNYIAMYFRGSDVCRNKQISLESFLAFCDQKITDVKINNPSTIILLASDNQDVLIKHVDEKQIFTNSIAFHLYKKDVRLDFHQTLHTPNINFTKEYFTSKDLCANAALDLFLLAHSKKLYADTKSGFGQWALKLHTHINEQKNVLA